MSRPASEIVSALGSVGSRAPIIFPVHPRTRARLSDADLLPRLEAAGVRCIDPVGYLDFLSPPGRSRRGRDRLGRSPGGDLP